MIQKNETPIDEIHRIRREISDRFGGDIAAIAADAARRQALSGRPVWHRDATNQAIPAIDGGPLSGGGQTTPAVE